MAHVLVFNDSQPGTGVFPLGVPTVPTVNCPAPAPAPVAPPPGFILPIGHGGTLVPTPTLASNELRFVPTAIGELLGYRPTVVNAHDDSGNLLPDPGDGILEQAAPGVRKHAEYLNPTPTVNGRGTLHDESQRLLPTYGDAFAR